MIHALKVWLYRWCGAEREINLLHDQQEALMRELQTLKNRFTSLIAVDWGFKKSGKIILLTRMNGKDRVKIIDCKPGMSREEYNLTIRELEEKYGAQLEWDDGPFESHPYRYFK